MGLKTEQLKCVDKFRDKNNKIIGYRLLDIYGKTHDTKADALKCAISKNLIRVTNLTLTSDNRLVDTKEKQLQSKQLGTEPQIELDNSILKIAKELCHRCNYTLDKNSIDENSVTINKKNDKIETYVYIELSTNNNIEITIGSDDFNFEKTVNSTDAIYKINSLIDNCKTPEELLKLATFIGNNLADELPEYEIGHILEKLYSIYGLKEDTEKLIQSRISKLIKNKKQISRQEIIDASARSGNYKYIDKDTNDSEIITEAIKAGLWFEAITSSLSCGESAIYAYKSGCYKQYKYDTMTKEDDPSKKQQQ